MNPLRRLLIAVLLALGSTTASAINVTEPPDMANTGLGTTYVLQRGTNTISGTVSPSDTQDYFQVRVPDGMRLASVLHISSDSGIFVFNDNQFVDPQVDNFYAYSPKLGPGTYRAEIAGGLSAATSWSFSFTVEVPGTVIGVDNFDYPDGNIAGRNGGKFWNYKNIFPRSYEGAPSNWDYIGFGGPATITGGRLITNEHGWAKREYNGANETLGAVNETNFDSVVYARATVTTGATLPNYFGIASYDFSNERLFLGKRSTGTFGYEIIGGASGGSGVAAPVNSTFTLVFRLDFAENVISLYLNPRLDLPLNHPLNSAPGTLVANATYTGTNWSTALRLASGSGGDPVAWDDFVVATSWEALSTTVTTTNDEDDGPASLDTPTDISLREAVKYSPTGRINFASNLAGGLIRLKLGEIPITGEITIDASGLSSGLIIDANEKSRHFQIGTGQSLTATGLTLAWGRGGSIENLGTLRLTLCTLMENRGGALLLSDAQTHLDHCTITGNVGDNSGSVTGGVDVLFGTCTLTHCTISGNQGSGGGGGLSINGNSASVTITRCILAGNSDTVAADIRKISGNLNIIGSSLIGNNQTVESLFPPSTLVGTPAAPINPQLSPVGRFGGLPFTMHPLIGSPAIDAAGSADPGGTDARGYARLVDGDATSSGAQLDIGAVEAGPLTTVTVAGDPGLPGSLRAVINAAVTPGARIGFSGSVFPTVIALAQGELSIAANQSIFIDASNLTAVTISGESATRIFRVNPEGTLAMHNLHLVNGKPTELPLGQGNINTGGAIFNDGTLTMLQSVVRNCTTIVKPGAIGDSGGGGAVYSVGLAHLSKCRLEQNVADADPDQLGNQFTEYIGGSGGAIRNDFGTLTILDSLFRENRTDDSMVPGHGGAIFNRDKLKIVRSSFEGNSGGSMSKFLPTYLSIGGSGGAIFNAPSGDVSISACLLSQNIAGNHWGAGGVGGGIVNSGVLTIHRSTITGNSSGGGTTSGYGFGGGIAYVKDPDADSGTLEVTHCTITGNRSSYAVTPTPTGSGIHNDTTTPYVLRHSIVSDNLTLNIVEDTSDATDLVGPVTQTENYIGGNPLLLPLDDNGGPTRTLALMPGSPAINTAFSSNNRLDQRDYPTVGTPDIGAYENERPVFSPPPVAVTVAPGAASVIVPFFVADRESGAAALTIVSLSKNGVIVPNPLFISSGANRTVTLAGPFSLSDPPAVYTIVISDGSATASASFTLTVAIAPPSLIVSNVNNAGEGSLRQALANAATTAGPNTVTFAPGFTGPVTLSSEIVIDDPAGVTLDASDRPNGLVIDGGTGTNRHFRIMAGTTATFLRLRLYGGNGTGGGGTTDGGSIHTSGTLTLRECTISDCASPSAAGAILSDHPGVLTLEHCTLYGNSSVAGGGAITQLSQNLLTLTACTIANNTAGSEAGGINAPFGRPVLLDHCTISGNAVIQTGGNGVGGVRGDGGGVPGVTVRNSIISANTDANFPGTPNINNFTATANNIIGGNARLAALGDYGGPTWTMPPTPGSPAIDAATTSTAATDQRGVGRPINGDGNATTIGDIGAVEVPTPLTVTTMDDENDLPAGTNVSLREAIRDAEPGSTILFSGSFNGEPADTITLSQTLGEIAFTQGLIIDASGNTGGVTIDGGPGTNRIFYLPAGTGAFLKRLTLTGGNGNFGGAIFCDGGRLALIDCTLTGNTSINGGAINNNLGTLTLDRCLLSGNNATGVGGAISSVTAPLTGPATSSTSLTNCTLTGNVSDSYGGAIRNGNGRTTLLHCTIFDNTAIAPSGSGVDSYGDDFTRTTVQNCLIVGNDNASDVDSGTPNTFVSLGGNVIGSGNATGAFNQLRDTTGHTAASLGLAPLADYGGPTQTMASRPGSPARDIATPSRISTDQRGFGVVFGTKDSGAYEAGNYFLESFNVFAQEFLPPTASDPQRARTFDLDGDGQTNEAEWLAFTNAADPNSRFAASLFMDEGDLEISFPTITGRTYRLQQSSTLLSGSWVDSGLTPKSGNNAQQNFIVTPATGPARRFYRVSVSQP